jgi:hypothetical protein
MKTGSGVPKKQADKNHRARPCGRITQPPQA